MAGSLNASNNKSETIQQGGDCCVNLPLVVSYWLLIVLNRLPHSDLKVTSSPRGWTNSNSSV
ncbi:MAG: hypothetical protein IJ764_07090, partial [Bacteroidales bacterium]|nr:hypothetical protein [Bacteroidales bacterium]